MRKRRAKNMTATAAKIVSFENFSKKKNTKLISKNKAIPFHEMSKKDRKESIDAMRED